jgi:pimeloyl-ACP methyl ester carboxylesterase
VDSSTSAPVFVTTSDGVELAIERVGDNRRGTIVCLHAMMTDGRYLSRFAPRLAAEGFAVVVAEFRGHGTSQRPKDWTFDDLVELDLPAILSVTGTDVTIMGHSLGGLVACAALGTGRVPAVKRLALVTTSAWLGETLPRRAMMAGIRAIAQVAGKMPVRAVRAGPNDEALGYTLQLTGWARHRRWASNRGVDYRAQLANITTPTVAICGGNDWMCRPADADAIASRIPTCEPVQTVAGASHFSLFGKYADTLVKKLCH